MKEAKSKIIDLKAKRGIDFVTNKDPKKVVTGNKIRGSGVDLPTSNKKPMMKAKSAFKKGK